MKVDVFDFELPADRIAQHPPAERGSSRLLRLDRRDGSRVHDRFASLPKLLRAGDLLVLNDTRVLPARLVGRKPTGGVVEVLLVEPAGDDRRWTALVRSSRGPRPGAVLDLSGGLTARVLAIDGGRAELELNASAGSVTEAIEAVGRMPLPPYIDRGGATSEAEDRSRYQTVYARRPGAVAAPTAGLHFTDELLGAIREAGVQIGRLTLHVGPGTFQPVRVEEVVDHRMHGERFVLPASLAEQVRGTRTAGGRVVAVGTTVVRTLEGRALPGGQVSPGEGRCDLFIYPGYRFRVVDALLTNFHLPRSTLLMLVAAFAGRDRVLEAYRDAIARGYRFYSYGDAMWIE